MNTQKLALALLLACSFAPITKTEQAMNGMPEFTQEQQQEAQEMLQAINDASIVIDKKLGSDAKYQEFIQKLSDALTKFVRVVLQINAKQQSEESKEAQKQAFATMKEIQKLLNGIMEYATTAPLNKTEPIDPREIAYIAFTVNLMNVMAKNQQLITPEVQETFAQAIMILEEKVKATLAAF